MTLRLITSPAVLPVSLIELKATVGLDDAADDARLAGCLRAAVNLLDGAEGLLGKALIEQTWELSLPAFPHHRCQLNIPLPPLLEVLSVTYTDTDGAEQTLATDQYQVAGVGSPYSAWIATAYATTWPATRYQDEAVTITYRCGYGPDWNSVPEGLRHGILVMATAMFDGCSAGEAAGDMISTYKTRMV